jgi:hypothetical protein
MPNYTITIGTGHINVSPVTFRLAAQDFFKCYLDFQKPSHISVVPFFLCCRALELAFKAIHLETKSQSDVKSLYSHDLLSSYTALDPQHQTLSQEELTLLTQANAIYRSKEFEYINVYDVGTAYGRFPDIDGLARIARNVTGFDQ